MPLKMLPPTKVAPAAKVQNVIAIAAGKGGVGKSSLTVNLAVALKLKGFSVGIMDADLYGPSIRKMLPEDRFPGQKSDTFIPAECLGIKMISMAYFRRENEAAAIRAPIANGVISQFIKNVDWGELDFLFIDFPPGTGDIQLTLSQQANLTGAILITTPQEIALIDVRKASHLFYQVKVPLIGVVENMSYYYHQATKEKIYLFGKRGGSKLALELGVPFIGEIPLDPEICDCGDLGKSLFANGDSSSAQAYFNVADAIVAHAKVLREQTHDSLSPFELIWKEMP